MILTIFLFILWHLSSSYNTNRKRLVQSCERLITIRWRIKFYYAFKSRIMSHSLSTRWNLTKKFELNNEPTSSSVFQICIVCKFDKYYFCIHTGVGFYIHTSSYFIMLYNRFVISPWNIAIIFYLSSLLPLLPCNLFSVQKPEWSFKIINQIMSLPCLELLKGFPLPLQKNKIKHLYCGLKTLVDLISGYCTDLFSFLFLRLLLDKLHPCCPHGPGGVPGSFLACILWGYSYHLENNSPYLHTADFSFLFR